MCRKLYSSVRGQYNSISQKLSVTNRKVFRYQPHVTPLSLINHHPEISKAIEEKGSRSIQDVPSSSGMVLNYEKDKYKGVLIDSECLPNDEFEFVTKLKYSLDNWRKLGRRGVWLKLPTMKSHLISSSLQLGFTFHHAEKVFDIFTCLSILTY